MNPTIRNILAVVAGCVAGGVVNMEIIMQSSSIVPPPHGADLTTTEGLKAAMHLMTPIHFLMPFLAHSLGTLAGAYLTGLVAVGYKMRLALLVGVVSLVGGISAVVMLPSPLWFTVTDLCLAYLPMAWLGGYLAIKTE